MQRHLFLKRDSFILLENRFRAYVKSKDLDLWHVITNGDFQPIIQNSETKLDEVVPFEKQTDDLNRRLAKIMKPKCQVKDNKIDLLVQQYEQFVISEDESIDSAFARFNTIITSLKALDEESKDLISLSLDKLIGNLKVNEMIIKKDSEIVKACGNEYPCFKRHKKDLRRVRFVRQIDDKKTFQRAKTTINGKSKRSALDAAIHIILIGECPKATRLQDLSRIVARVLEPIIGEKDDEKIQDKKCLAAKALNEEIRKYQEESFTHKEEMTPMALSDSESNLANYKRGLASVKERLVFYKKNEVMFCEQIVVLKRDITYKDSDISVLKCELEKLKKEKEMPDKVILMLFVVVAQDKLILLDKRQWLMLLERTGLMLLKHPYVGFGDLSNLIGNPETKLEDLVRLNSPKDEKRAGAELTQQNDKSQYKKLKKIFQVVSTASTKVTTASVSYYCQSNIDAAQPKLMLLVNIVNAD
ncbi:hypothetical protein Tco_1204678 [Tanacetum coccineum]